MHFSIRSFHTTDLTSLYRICLLTGDNGKDGSRLYNDPDIPGHIFAAPYAYFEPDLCFVLTRDNLPCGYILGTRDSVAFHEQCERDWFAPLRERYPLASANDVSPQAKMIRLLHVGHRPHDEAESYPAHLHIDILPEGQGQGLGRKLIETFLNRLKELGVLGVHLGVGKQNPKAIGFYEKLGFQMLQEMPTYLLLGMKLQ
ncbi:MAG: N-acetyltransferase [Chloroflexi bacterium]|nr:MAG: N-acetyltransferase [Chloroflexota bacterium]